MRNRTFASRTTKKEKDFMINVWFTLLQKEGKIEQKK